MNLTLSEIKTIPVHVLAEELGGRYCKTDRNGDLWYYSPFRPEEKTASFKINVKLNTWHDFGLSGTAIHRNQGSGGDILDLWCDYYFKDRRLGINQAAAAITAKHESLAIRGESLQHQPRYERPTIQNQNPRYKIERISKRIAYHGLLHELSRRRISTALANIYLKQGMILDTVTGKHYTGFLFENDKGGYEVSIPNPSRNTCFKTIIGRKASSRVLSKNKEANAAEVFEGFWDFLSWMEINALLYPLNHAYVLNSVSLVNEVSDKIMVFENSLNTIFLFMDNDKAGKMAALALTENLKASFAVGSMAHIYNGKKDLNEFWASGKSTEKPQP